MNNIFYSFFFSSSVPALSFLICVCVCMCCLSVCVLHECVCLCLRSGHADGVKLQHRRFPQFNCFLLCKSPFYETHTLCVSVATFLCSFRIDCNNSAKY